MRYYILNFWGEIEEFKTKKEYNQACFEDFLLTNKIYEYKTEDFAITSCVSSDSKYLELKIKKYNEGKSDRISNEIREN